MEKLAFYKVDVAYADYLRKFDAKVPFIELPHYKRNKFFVGVVFKIDNLDYFAPVTSYTGSDKGSFSILNEKGEVVSSVRPNYMFPVIDGVYEMLDINKEYSGVQKRFVLWELAFCNKYREEIFFLARKTYQTRTQPRNEREALFFKDRIIDFKKLENAAKKYKK